MHVRIGLIFDQSFKIQYNNMRLKMAKTEYALSYRTHFRSIFQNTVPYFRSKMAKTGKTLSNRTLIQSIFKMKCHTIGLKWLRLDIHARIRLVFALSFKMQYHTLGLKWLRLFLKWLVLSFTSFETRRRPRSRRGCPQVRHYVSHELSTFLETQHKKNFVNQFL